MSPKGKNFRVGTGTGTGTVEIKCWNPEPRQNWHGSATLLYTAVFDSTVQDTAGNCVL
jgi:hypothetical protein